LAIVITETITSSNAGSYHPGKKNLQGVLSDTQIGIIVTQLLGTSCSM